VADAGVTAAVATVGSSPVGVSPPLDDGGRSAGMVDTE
jgi:hypothetical protein